jgi:hypothetical protein
VLDPGLTITGRVVDGKGTPLADWMVDAKPHPYGRVYPRQASTDGEGRFTLANLDSDYLYDLEARERKEFARPASAAMPGVVPGTKEVEIVVKDLPGANAHVHGRVIDADGHPPADAKLLYYPEKSDSGWYVEFDGTSGEFTSGRLAAGKCDLRVMRGGQTVLRTSLIELHPDETAEVGELRIASPGHLELTFVGVPATDLHELHPDLNRDGYNTESLSLEEGSFHSRALGPGRWVLDMSWGFMGWFIRSTEIEIRPGETTRVELHPVPGHAVSFDCSFADPDAKWTLLSLEVKDEDGEIVRTFKGWERSSMREGKLHIDWMTLPAGRFEIEARTDTGMRGSVAFEVGAGSANGATNAIVLR